MSSRDCWGLGTVSEPRMVFMLKEMNTPALKRVFLWTENLQEGLWGCASGAKWDSSLGKVVYALGPAFLICESGRGAVSGE